MKKTIKILFVEDNLSDAQLIYSVISRSNIDFVKELVDTEKDYISALRLFEPDLILSDFSMPQFDGMTALMIRNDLTPDIPFLIVTGAQNEEIAVECMKAGADDYIIKQNLSRLSEAIKSAINKKEIILQKRIIEKNLRISEDRFREVAENIGEWVWEVNADGLFKFVSPVSNSLLGYTPEELINKKYFYDFFLHDCKEELKAKAFEIFSRKENFKKFEHPNIHKDGHLVYLETSGSPILDDKKNLIGYRGADKNITEQKYAIEMLRRSEEKFNKAFHISPDAIVITRSSDGLFSEINEAFEKISGYPREEIIGMTSTDLNLWVDEDDRDHLISILKQKGRVTDFKSLFKTKLDAILNISLSGEIYEVNGEDYMLVIIRDITEQLRSEEALKESEARFRSYFNLSGAGLAITSPSTGWIEVNDQLCTMLGYSSEEIYRSTWPQLTHPDDLDIDMENFDQVISGKINEYSIDKRFLRKDGETIWTNLSVSCVRDQTGQVDYFVALLFDITERKHVETELIKAKLKAEESDRLKTAFLHNVSHEIRTPLNAILGFGSLLSEPGLPPDEQVSYLETIQEGSDQLLSIVGTIVDISSAEAKVLKKNVTSFNLNSTLKNLFKQFLLKAPENSNSLNMRQGLNDEDSFILTDNIRFIQIISNLLNNALKFTKNGSVDFGYTVNDKMIEFYICDTGIGIPSDELTRIYDSFYQIESTDDRKYGGTGLGLSICKAYVELLGGKIWVTSELSVGSTFYFNIPYDKYTPLSPVKPIEKKIEEISKNTSHVLLVVEDDEITFNLISKFLSDPFLTILRAHNGQEAVDACKSRMDIDLILMDINMPVMDGYSATRLIRVLRPEVPVVAQTAYADDKIEALKSGCVDFIVKPFKKNDILKILNEYLVK